MNPFELEENGLFASGTDDIIDPPKVLRYSDSEWTDMQRARINYLKEWEEDMRYAQELANEGM